MRTVVVTGLGMTTPLGGNATATWAGMLAGRSGVRAGPPEWPAELPVRIAGFAAREPGEWAQARTTDRCQQLALVAAAEAWQDAGRPEVDRERLAVVIGSTIGGGLTLLDQYDVLRVAGPCAVAPPTMAMVAPNGAAAAVAQALGAGGGVHAPVSACASGAEALAFAADLIRAGRADVVVAGGAEAMVHPLALSGFAAIGALSTRSQDPPAASRPFDRNRDGFVLGEGAGVLVLEAGSFAAARGARQRAVLAGARVTSDGFHVAAPDPTGRGVARAVGLALRQAGLAPGDVRHVNAHATATPRGDVAEACGLRAALGPAADGAAVTAVKSMTGHMIAAAGAVEAAATVLALRDGLCPPIRNLDEPDDDVELDLVRALPRALGAGAALSTSFGFGGHNVCLAFTT